MLYILFQLMDIGDMEAMEVVVEHVEEDFSEDTIHVFSREMEVELARDHQVIREAAIREVVLVS